jgi:bifunctional non-homologous end joining protein LigD
LSLIVTAGRRRVEIRRPEKELFPDGITKADLARYYEAVAPAMLPLVKDRPLNLERYPDGITGQRIMQQRAGSHFPDWIERVDVPKQGGTVTHVIARDAATLVYLADQACITLHNWLSRRDRLDRPDRLIVDLDPSTDGDPDSVRRAAVTISSLLEEIGLRSWAMTTGSRGYHVVVPLQRRSGFDQVRELARDLGALAERRDPRTFTNEQRKAKREGKILIDVLRNAYAHTAVAPYAVRPRPGAPVATPLHALELSDALTRPQRWTLREVPKRLERDGDPWRDLASHAQSLAAARRRLAQALAE